MNSVTYVLYSEDVDSCILIDCGQWRTLKPVLDKIGKRVKAVLLTHGHSDHIHGITRLTKEYSDAEICTLESGHEELSDMRKNLSLYHGLPFTIDNYNKKILTDGEILHFEGLLDIEVIVTPGHDTSCVSYKVGMSLFTGDAYIPGIKVFTKFPRGNKPHALESYKKLKQMEEDGFKIYCGHHDYNNLVNQ